MKNIILLNGPPESGKDYLADMLCETRGAIKEKMANPISWALQSFISADYDVWQEIRNAQKESLFIDSDLTTRQALISFSEDWAKVKFGETIFARLLYERIIKNNLLGRHDTVVISDCGFQLEHDWFVKSFAESHAINPILVNLCRQGKTFEGDSREYVRPINENQKHLVWYNRGTRPDADAFLDKLALAMEGNSWMKKH